MALNELFSLGNDEIFCVNKKIFINIFWCLLIMTLIILTLFGIKEVMWVSNIFLRNVWFLEDKKGKYLLVKDMKGKYGGSDEKEPALMALVIVCL